MPQRAAQTLDADRLALYVRQVVEDKVVTRSLTGSAVVVAETAVGPVKVSGLKLDGVEFTSNGLDSFRNGGITVTQLSVTQGRDMGDGTSQLDIIVTTVIRNPSKHAANLGTLGFSLYFEGAFMYAD
jgi:hypothetical protein